MEDEVIAEMIPGVIRPTDTYPIVTAGPRLMPPLLMPPLLMSARWGLIPAWAKEAPQASTFNARIETAGEKPTFRGAFARRHALVPADGFYEWSGGRRHRITRRDGEPMVFAGLWEGETFTILTRAARTDMAALHDREPVMVGRRQWQDWLDNALFDPALPPDGFLSIEDADDAPVQERLF